MEKLQWLSDGNKCVLKNGDEQIIQLSINLIGKSTCIIHGSHYDIYKKGFWNPVYHVSTDGQEIAKLYYGVWESRGKIIFADGAEFQNDYHSKNGLKLRFFDNENEILEFGIACTGKNPMLNFKVGVSMVDAEKLLLLAALGMVLFFPVLKEISAGTDNAIFLLLVI